MRLEALFDDHALPRGDLEISGLTADSRLVEPGFLFAAIPGTRLDGRRFIADAVAKGATAILSTPDAASYLRANGRAPALVADPNPRRRLALAAARFYGRQPERVVAVTGTNGKTSVASFVQQIWSRLGHKGASMGTLGIRGPGVDRPGALTTPDPVSLHKDLAALADAGIDRLAIEASSHGLDQFRLDGIRFTAAAFTNLSRDHIDYHQTMRAYLDAKLRLFTELLPADGTAVLNADSGHFGDVESACRRHGRTVMTYGQKAGRDGIRIERVEPRPEGLVLALRIRNVPYRVALPLAGGFQAWNAVCALGLVLATGGDEAKAAQALSGLKGAPGRLERVATHPGGAPVYVDYAHTPDALETVLDALRPHTRGRLGVVFGCGGDRDAGKRPMMGAVAAKHADRVWITDDNPRSENAAAIRREILPACPGAVEIGDRAQAIEAAITALGPDDLLVIAGKGHEQGQIVGDKVIPFDDAAVARAAVAGLGGAAA
jgi:UDP-N-acetylmuramoyl-L-alanyl-D-glutamate--2,6-diaminopimelate ligase